VRRASWLKGALHTDLRDAIAAECILEIKGALRPLKEPYLMLDLISATGKQLAGGHELPRVAAYTGPNRFSVGGEQKLPSLASLSCSLQLKPRD
jgi:hypothetical protein